MKTVIIYRPMSEFARSVEEFVHEFSRRYPDRPLEVLDIDGRDGGAMMSLYDIQNHPAVLALRADGSVSMVWQGEQMPLLDEVVSYTLSTNY
jgi:hypothetical protein